MIESYSLFIGALRIVAKELVVKFKRAANGPTQDHQMQKRR